MINTAGADDAEEAGPRSRQTSITWPSAAAPAATPAGQPGGGPAERLGQPGRRHGGLGDRDRGDQGRRDRHAAQHQQPGDRQRVLTNISGSSESGQRTAPIRNRLAGEAFQVMVPVTTPESSEPRAQAITITPVVRQDARLLGEGDDDDLHAAEQHAQGGAGDGDGSSDARPEAAGSAAFRAAGWSGGCGAALGGQRQRADQAEGAAGREPSAGCSEVARKVASTGPTMKTTSSSTASTGEGGVQQR